ncbi:hypothetical protein ACFZAV_17400 [Streptomyces sp. NPDC008343]|uniref:hypothetical protein n=1 Tax=Streptomyces sp. NPDC008343 TaxID=3364828 RepID=UPI0036E61E92
MSVRLPHRIGHFRVTHAFAGASASAAEHPQNRQSEFCPVHKGSTVAGPPRPSDPA